MMRSGCRLRMLASTTSSVMLPRRKPPTRIAEGSRPAPCLPSDGSTAPNSSQSRLRSTQKVMHPLNGASFADKGSFCCSESKASRSSARRHMSRYSGRDAGQLTSAPASIFALC